MNKIKEILSLTKFDFKQRYNSTNLGSLWYLVTPLVMIFIYTVIFSDFMNARLGINSDKWSYSLYLVPGLFSFAAFQNTILNICDVPTQKAGVLKKISIPLYAFEISPTIIQIIIFSISMILGVIFLSIVSNLNVQILLIIPMMILQSIFAFALGVILSILSIFIKDIKEGLPIFLQLLFWATPIVYPYQIIEQKLPILLEINPLYYFIKFYQKIFLSKNVEYSDFITLFILSMITLLIAAYIYKKLISAIKDMY
ncbi:TPA: ABC transporter permease [Campylobacter fetus subsp. venerealis]|nr:ABC transporter permease [Campylobacter fetus subsp. venerealis]